MRFISATHARSRVRTIARPYPPQGHRVNISLVNPPRPLILASNSSYRAELLRRLVPSFGAVPADIDESRRPGECPRVARMGFPAACTIMKFCSQCGGRLVLLVPPGDNRQRHVCARCNAIHYQNPKLVTGCIPEWQGQVLLCRRAIEPRYGLWTLPAGFMENGESTHEGAVRETLEEANARVGIDDLFVTVNLPHINQVYMLFRGRLLDLDFHPGEESLAVELLREDQMPWDKMAFPTVSEALKLYFADCGKGRFPVRMLDIVRETGVPGRYQVRRIS